MNKKECLDILRKSGAFLDGHFALSSGLHSPDYVQCALALQDPATAREFGRGLAGLWPGGGISAVVSPALGGVIIGHETAGALGVKFLFTERHNGIMTLRRGFGLKAKEKVIIVEDVITTARSALETIDVVKSYGAVIAGILAIVNRGRDLAVSPAVKSLVELELVTYKPESCPMCRNGIPLMKPGSRGGKK